MFHLSYPKFTAIFFQNNQEIIKENYQNLTSKPNCINFNLLEYNTILDLENEIFSRENNDFFFSLNIKTKSCQITLKQENMEFPILVDYCELKITNNKITLEYMLETDDVQNKLIIMKLGDSL